MATMDAMGRALTVVRWTWPLLVTIVALRGQQYRADKAGSPPPELASGIARALQQAGFQISANGDPYCEIWFRTGLPSGAATREASLPLPNVTLPHIPQGTLLGALRFDGNGSDRRGQTIPAGVYTLRYGIMPANGSHQGAAPQRDFLLLTPAAEDRDVN